MKNVLRIICLLLLPIVIDSMTCCDCPDSERNQANFTYCGIELFNLDNSGRHAVIAASNSIPRAAYGMRIKVDRKKVERDDELCNRGCRSWFGTAAYATSCDCGWDTIYSPVVEIRKAKIITLNEFDTSHSAGDDITSYFHFFSGRTYNPVTDVFKKKLEETNYYDNEGLNKEIDFLLMTSPTSMTECSFQVVIELSDGRVLEAITNPVILQ